MRRLVAVVLHIGAASLCVGCMDTRSASLGVEAQRGAPVAPDAALEPMRRDASVGDAAIGSEPVDATDPDDGEHHDGDGDDDAHGEDASNAVVDPPRDAQADAAPAPATLDAGRVALPPVDARVEDTSVGHNDERDGGRDDARTPVNPLCIAEPWHCQ